MDFVKNYHIEMLSVGAADAFILYVIDTHDNEHIILIDSGNYNDGETIINHIRRYYAHPTIDLAIVTHSDDDHYGGYIRMLEKLSQRDYDAIKIKRFWINDPGNNHIDVEDVKHIRLQNSVNNKARQVYNIGDKNLLHMIDLLEIPREEKFANNPLDGRYPFLYIIGPTKEYYEWLIPNFRDNLQHKNEDDIYEESRDIQTDHSYSPTLDAATDDDSAHNQSSMIILFNTGNKKYLFMGDAGRAAYNKIPAHNKHKIHNVDWLKVPHHGSKHNLDSEMIAWINPKTAYISAANHNRYANRCTINALKRALCTVYSTHKEHCHYIHNQVGERLEYTTATPL